ncbi:hypothetical protein [Siccirubricoccus phaeus]|uniref:hypothetical protein n=1 Tax=Siccirubricoccus phaeus TaxID=2595053 RepID=UPI0011F26867|nr:hypothetical protein [Siccirubricoccus phaeus]
MLLAVPAYAAGQKPEGQGRSPAPQARVVAQRLAVVAPRPAAAASRPAQQQTASRPAAHRPAAQRQAGRRQAAQRVTAPVQRSAMRGQVGMVRDARAASANTAPRRLATKSRPRVQTVRWMSGLPAAANVQAQECPDGTMATLARGHDDIVRCVPF